MLTEADLPPRTFIPVRWMLALGGVARTSDFRERGISDVDLRLAVRFGNVIRVRIGWHALPGVDPAVLEAVRLGGRLACRSALAHHDAEPIAGPLHVEIPANAVRRDRPADAVAVRYHWVRRPSRGSRGLVERAAAARQAEACRASLEA